MEAFQIFKLVYNSVFLLKIQTFHTCSFTQHEVEAKPVKQSLQSLQSAVTANNSSSKP